VSLLRDIRFAVRLLVKNGGVTIVSAVVLALGIGSLHHDVASTF
jgi:hypothetical protein